MNNKITRFYKGFLIGCTVIVFGFCKDPKAKPTSQNQESTKVHKIEKENYSDSDLLYKLDSAELTIIVNGKNIVINRNNGEKLTGNTCIIRKTDENANCPSEGFLNIVCKGMYFTIEQQNCAGWYFIKEFITFKYSPKEQKILLHRFGLQYVDRKDPDKVIPDKSFSQKDFGRLYFDQVNLDSLYKLNR